MKLKILTLIICFTFNFLNFSSAAVDVKKNEKITVLESESRNTLTVKLPEKRRWFQKKRKLKRWKFRGFNFLKWKKRKPEKQKKTKDVDKPNVDVFALFSVIFTVVGIISLLPLGVGSFLTLGLSLITLGGIFGIIGLIRIKRKSKGKFGKQEKQAKQGKSLAKIGVAVLGTIALLLLVGLILILIWTS